MSYGPALPPHLQKKRDDDVGEEDEKKESEEKKSDGGEESDDGEDCYGPALPPGFKRPQKEEEQEEEEDVLGPQLPPGFRKRPAAAESEAVSDDDDEDDEAVIGPMPPAPGTSSSSAVSAAEDFERRSRKMRDRLEGKDADDGQPKRETWMLELPPEKAKNFGLGPRTFSKSSAEPKKKGESRNAWTDTPEMKARRERGELVDQDADDGGGDDPSQDKDVLEYLASIKRDEEMEKVTKELREKRGTESLMDKHTKKLHKKAKREAESGKPKERRPFDRDVDLQANRFDEAAKKAMLKKAAKLDNRFSSGATKYL